MASLISYRNIDVLILDIDHVINHYDADFANQFPVATAGSFWKLYPALQQQKINHPTTSFEKTGTHMFWIEYAEESYRTRGRTTALFKEQFPQINEMDLYVHHHDMLCKDGGFVDQQFAQGKIKIDHELPQLLERLNQLGVSIFALTHGTERYAEKILMRHGVARYFEAMYGFDSVDNPYMSEKGHGVFLNDILDKSGLLKRFNRASGQGMEDFDHSHIALIDDTHRNLRAAKFRFGMQTILQVNNPQWNGPTRANAISYSLNNTLRYIIDAKVKRYAYPILAAQ